MELARVQPAAYRVWFGGGSGGGGGQLGKLGERNTLDLLNDEAAMAEQLEAVEPGAAKGYRCAAVHCGALRCTGVGCAFAAIWLLGGQAGSRTQVSF